MSQQNADVIRFRNLNGGKPIFFDFGSMVTESINFRVKFFKVNRFQIFAGQVSDVGTPGKT